MLKIAWYCFKIAEILAVIAVIIALFKSNMINAILFMLMAIFAQLESMEIKPE